MGAATDHRPAQYERRRPEESVLYRTVATHLETFLASRIAEGNALPDRVEKELRAYLRCGILQYGFTRTACPTCAFERIVAFSCKGRGFCPSCSGKRMAETAAHLIDDVLPWVPYRQWVVTLPMPLRFWCARSPELTSAVHGMIKKEIVRHQTSVARAAGIQDPLPGGITFIQRSGSALNINVHYHVLALDGVYAPPTRSDGKPRFYRLPPPTDDNVAAVVEKIANRTVALLRKRGYLDAGAEEVPRPDVAEMFAEHPAAEAGLAASVT